jgi:uncharacterized protein (TIGR02246 family)
MLRRALLATVCVAISVSAYAQDKATIDKLNEKFAEAFNRGDTAAVAAMYTDNAFVLPPGSEMVKGREGAQSFWKGAAEQLGALKLTAVDVKPLGSEAAREVGTFSAKTKGQAPQDVAGKYVVIWERAGGEWKIATDIWNADK